jgi:mono/diheme cytochrome c family protein
MLKHWIAGVVCLALMACGGSSDDGDDEDEGEDGDMCAATGLDFAAGDAAAGEEIYSAFCASCHGADGLGNASAAAASSRGVDLHDEISEGPAGNCWVEVIKNGEGSMGPVVGITDEQIVDVIAYMNANFAH